MTLFDKTARGREEIATRGHALAPRLRTLLLLVDGKTDSAILLSKVAGLGLSQEHLKTLLEGGMIQLHEQPHDTRAADVGAIAVPGQAVNAGPATTHGTKLERASSIEDANELRQVYLEAILKSKGEEISRSLGADHYRHLFGKDGKNQF
jgi:hypothetical protein